MHILFTHRSFFDPTHGGIGRVTDRLCRAFANRGFQTSYLIQEYDSELYGRYNCPSKIFTLPNKELLHDENIHFYHNFLHREKVDIVVNQSALYYESKLFLNTGIAKSKKISVLHSNPIENYNNLWFDLKCLKNNTFIEHFKRILRCSLYCDIKFKQWKRIKQHFNFLSNNTDILCLLSKKYLPTLNRIDKSLNGIATCIPNPNTYDNVYYKTPKNKEVIFVGRLDNRSKKILSLLEIWKGIELAFPDWKLSLVGDGVDRNIIQNYIEKNKLQNVTMYGYMDPQQFYKRAAIICLTSCFEGWPMVLTEAMQFGCIPIAFNSFEALDDIIIDEKTGILVTPFNLNEYRKKLSVLMSNHDYRLTLSCNAMKHVDAFSCDNIVDMWQELFYKLCNK